MPGVRGDAHVEGFTIPWVDEAVDVIPKLPSHILHSVNQRLVDKGLVRHSERRGHLPLRWRLCRRSFIRSIRWNSLVGDFSNPKCE